MSASPVPTTVALPSRWPEKLAYLSYQIRRSPMTMAGLAITVLVLLCMIFAPWLASHDPNALNLSQRLAEPSAAHWFGTDEVGRDLFSRVLYGSRQSACSWRLRPA
jgi:peptide/nickel transport system permease protein